MPLQFDNPSARYDMACADGTVRHRVRVWDSVLDDEALLKLACLFPEAALLARHLIGVKDRLAEEEAGFERYVAEHPEWSELFDEIRNRFAALCFAFLGVQSRTKPEVRIEFSLLPREGGSLVPHPDTPRKIATAVLFVEPYWESYWGGGFEVLRHRDAPDADWTDYSSIGWDDVVTEAVVDVAPARMFFMRRTKNSLHGVRPIRAPIPRRSLTINLIGRAA